MKWPNHGGQPSIIKQMFKLSTEADLYDFSANLNPLGPPSWFEKELQVITKNLSSYPDPTYREARTAIGDCVGMDYHQVMVTNGGAEAIFLVAKLFEGKRALIVQPTFTEYEQACRHYHVEVEDVFLEPTNNFQFPLEEVIQRLGKADLLFICRPNNPTGTIIEEETLRQIIEYGAEFNKSIVIDEAFSDFLPQGIEPLTDWVKQYSNIILLRSLTKMFTIPGLRIGYILADQTIIERCLSFQVPWSVNSIAAEMVPLLIKDTQFVERTRDWLEKQLTGLKGILLELDYEVSSTWVNFYLLQDRRFPEKTEELYHYLLANGILPRHTHNFKGLDGRYLRLAVRTERENEKLLHLLRQWRENT
jgi:threonine-phosphate decarboxylase